MRISDWSSDVCSSDLDAAARHLQVDPGQHRPRAAVEADVGQAHGDVLRWRCDGHAGEGSEAGGRIMRTKSRAAWANPAEQGRSGWTGRSRNYRAIWRRGRNRVATPLGALVGAASAAPAQSRGRTRLLLIARGRSEERRLGRGSVSM